MVKTEVFSGPLEYLIELIYKNEIDPLNIPVSFLIEEFLIYLKKREWRDLSRSIEFLLMIALLIHIKISRFLPSKKKEEDEEKYISVEEITEEYEKLLTLTGFLEKKKDFFENVFPRGDSQTREEMEADVFSLYKVFSEIISAVKEEKALVHDVPKIEEKIEDIINRLKQRKKLKFREIFENCRRKIEVIVYFLAILELLKNKRIKVRQGNLFSEIYVYLA